MDIWAYLLGQQYALPRRARKNPSIRSYESLANEARDNLQQDIADYLHSNDLWDRTMRFRRGEGSRLHLTSEFGFEFHGREMNHLGSLARKHGFEMPSGRVEEGSSDYYISFRPRRLA